MIKVAVVQRVLLHYRVRLLERIAADPRFELLLLHGSDIAGTKFVNYKGQTAIKRRQLLTYKYSKGSSRVLTWSPGLFLRLWQFGPDIILLEGESNMLNNAFVHLYAVLFKKPYIWWGLGRVPGDKVTFYQRLYRPLMRRMLRRASHVIGYSNYSRDYYAQYTSRDRILVAHNCLDNERIDEEIAACRDQVHQVREELGLDGKQVILFVGNLERRKGIDRLLRAVAILRAAGGSTALLIVGDGNCRQDLERLANELGLEDVHFIGQVVDGVSRYFLASDLFVLPGRGGLAIYHAMVHGLPVVSARADGTERDLILDGYNGYLLKTDAVEELAAVIRETLLDGERCRQMGINSRKTVDEKINIRTMITVFERALLEAAGLREEESR